jgi:hypothetical protein
LVTGASGSVLAADPGAVATLDDGPKFAIALATMGFLVVLLLILRVSRARSRGDGGAAEPEVETTPSQVADSPEAHIPRWRRPSVVAGRFGMVVPTSTRTERQAFEPSEEQPAERFVIRYDAVPLVDQPDDVHGRTIDELSAGDEVEVVDRQTLWVHVRTPAGRVGWVPAMTLATLEELPPELWASEGADDPAPEIDEGPPLEQLLAAIVAGRQTATEEPPAATPTARPKRARAARSTRVDESAARAAAEAAAPRASRRKAATSGS